MKKETTETNNIQKEITCNNCGAKLIFEPGTDNLKCEFCGAVNKIETDETEKAEAVKELDYENFVNNNNSEKIKITTIKCDTCGAETTFDSDIITSICDFCGSPLISENTHTSEIISPKALLPFKITKKQALELYQKKIQKLWFAPSKLKTKTGNTAKLSGVYIPFWTFDTHTRINYRGKRGDDYIEKTISDDGETISSRRTKWTNVSGNINMYFNDIIVPASKSLPTDLIYDLDPWNLKELVPYNTKYLSGFKTETYQINLKKGFDTAKIKIEPDIRFKIRQDIGGDRQQIDFVNTEYSNTKFKHILMPVWISSYKYNDKIYRFIINAQTGKVKTERPWSKIKIIIAVAAIISITGALIYFLQNIN